MALDLPTALVNLAEGLVGIAKPYVDAHVAQKYENECKSRLSQWGALIAENNPTHINSFVLQLIADGGQTAGGVGADVTLDIVSALIAIACGKIKDDEMLANIQFTKIEGS